MFAGIDSIDSGVYDLGFANEDFRGGGGDDLGVWSGVGSDPGRGKL